MRLLQARPVPFDTPSISSGSAVERTECTGLLSRARADIECARNAIDAYRHLVDEQSNPPDTGYFRVALPHQLRVVIAGEMLIVIACIVVLLTFQHVQPNDAYVLSCTALFASGVAATRRVPFAWWWSVGIVLGVLVACFS
jgi:hypothetical protein